MSESIKTLVPKLRFSEFKDAGEWNEEELTKFSECELSNGVFNDPKKVGSGYKLINVLDMFIDTVVDEEKLSLVELSKNEFLKNKVETGDIFFTRSSLVKSGIAYSNIYVGNSCDITFDGHLIRFRPNKNILTPMFANYLLRTSRVRTQLVARGKTATMTTIGQADVSGVKLTVPDINEQQKIADCLSSIDELITAQTKKIAALKDHKKGLMQQLYPLEGETVPKLRLSEFQDSGGWNEEELTKFSECELSNGVFNDPKKVGSGYKLINVLDMFIDTVVDEEKLSLVELSKNEFLKNKVETGDIFFTRSSLVKSGIAYSNIYVGNSCDITFDGHLIRFRPNKNILIPMFANYLLRTTRVRTQLVARGKTATMTTIGQADVGGVKLTVPDINEQQKIAACLTSVDNLITEQTQKIEAYKAHKKGLMQRLFPIDIQE